MEGIIPLDSGFWMGQIERKEMDKDGFLPLGFWNFVGWISSFKLWDGFLPLCFGISVGWVIVIWILCLGIDTSKGSSCKVLAKLYIQNQRDFTPRTT